MRQMTHEKILVCVKLKNNVSEAWKMQPWQDTVYQIINIPADPELEKYLIHSRPCNSNPGTKLLRECLEELFSPHQYVSEMFRCKFSAGKDSVIFLQIAMVQYTIFKTVLLYLLKVYLSFTELARYYPPG